MNIEFSSVNFGATPLYNIKLKKRINNAYQTVDARVSELNPHDKTDQQLMQELGIRWNSEDPHSILGIIKENFERMAEEEQNKSFVGYYITELLDESKKTSVPNITSIVEVIKPSFCNKDDMLYINSLQSNPANTDQVIPPVKGAGELAMYAMVKLARMLRASSIQLDSCANGFYKEIGFREAPYDSIFVLDRPEFDTFIKRVENKYSFNS